MQFILAGFVSRYYPPPAKHHNRGASSMSMGSRSSATALAAAAAARESGQEQQEQYAGKYLAELLLYLWAFVAANTIWVFFWNFLDRAFFLHALLLLLVAYINRHFTYFPYLIVYMCKSRPT
jgi:hypothetical protein